MPHNHFLMATLIYSRIYELKNTTQIELLKIVKI